MLLPEELIKNLCSGPIDTPEYLKDVEILAQKLTKVKNQDIQDSKVLQEVKPEIEKLQFKVSQRARNFLIAQFNTLKKPRSNFQIYQENVLLKFKPLVSFLRSHHLQTYIELTKIYAEQMEDVYDERLKTYFKDTAKLIARAPRSSEFLFASQNENETL